MSIYNSQLRFRCLVMPAAALLATACFDVERVDVTNTTRARLLIDDFEDGDNVPTSNLFAPTSCYTFSQDPTLQSLPPCGIAAGYESTFGYMLPFSLQAPPIETSDGIGVGLSTPSAVGTVDISSYKSIHFDAKMDLGSPTPPVATVFQVGIACDSVHHPQGTVKGGFQVTYDFAVADEFPLSGEWKSITIKLAQFTQPGWQVVRMFDKTECLRVVDSLFFDVQSPLVSGQSAAGILTIDNVWLE